MLKTKKMKNKKNKVLLIDGNNLLHRVYHQYKSMRAEDGTLTSIIFGFPYVLNSLINLHRPQKVCVVFDGGRSRRRLEILPNYKNREKKDDFDYENFIAQKEILMELLKHLGIDVYIFPKEEADDIIGILARKYGRNSQVVIVSADKDFNQLINNRVSVWDPNKKERITHLNCKKITGYTPEECVDYLSLVGDTSDKIPGYKGIGPKTALKFLEYAGSIENYLNDKSLNFRIDRQALADLYNINKELIDIMYFVTKNKLKLKGVNITKGEFNQKEVRYICADHSITKIQKPEVLNTFKQLYDSQRI